MIKRNKSIDTFGFLKTIVLHRGSSKLLIFFTILFVFSNCSKSNDSNAIVDPDVDSSPDRTVTLNLEGIDDLAFENLTVLSPNGSSTIDDNGNIDDLAEQDDPDTPVLFIDGENDIILGYFPQTIAEEEISVDDVVYFFVKTYPGISILDLDDNELKASLMGSDVYETLQNIVVTALNKNEAISDKPEFDLYVREFLGQLEENNTTPKKEVVAQFKVDYERNGTIKLPTNAPIFSSFGVQITNVKTGTRVFEPTLLTSKAVVLSPGSFANFIIESLFEKPEEGTKNHTLIEDGIYEVYFTNGKGDTVLDEIVKEQNIRNFAVTVLGYIFPLATKDWMENRGCDDILFPLLEDIAKPFVSLLKNETIDEEDLVKFLKDISANTAEYIACNAITTQKQKYFSHLFKIAEKRLKVAEDVAQLLFIIRDYYGSDIRLSETRYFDNNISYGHLLMTDLTDLEFSIETGDTIQYQGLIREKEISYDVDRGALSSQFLQKVDSIDAAGIPFTIDIIGGDPILYGSNPIYSGSNGVLNLEGAMGNEDSIIELSSVLDNSQIPNRDIFLIQFFFEFTGKWYRVWRHAEGDFWQSEAIDFGNGGDGEVIGTYHPAVRKDCIDYNLLDNRQVYVASRSAVKLTFYNNTLTAYFKYNPADTTRLEKTSGGNVFTPHIAMQRSSEGSPC